MRAVSIKQQFGGFRIYGFHQITENGKEKSSDVTGKPVLTEQRLNTGQRGTNHMMGSTYKYIILLY